MDLSPTTEAWTSTVPWARSWRRPPVARRSRPAAPPRTLRAVPADVPLEAAWTTAMGELATARLGLAEAGRLDDAWVEAMAGHALYLAVRRVRVLEERLGVPDGPVHWSGV